MFSSIETWILEHLQALFDGWGWFGVAVIMAIDNLTGVIPSEIFLGLAGWMLISQHELSPAVILVGGFFAALGSTLGASGPYWLARLGGRPLVNRVVRLVRIPVERITRVEQQFDRWGAGLVFVGRVIPVVRILVGIPAGLARMNYFKYLAATFAGAYIWCTMLIGAGYVLGHEWRLIITLISQHFPYLLVFGLLALLVYLWLARRKLALAWAKHRGPGQHG